MSPELNTGNFVGLSEQEAAARLRAEGANELPSTKPRRLLATVLQLIHEPMLLLLVGAGTIYFLLGELKDSLALLVSIVAVLGISLYQQRKTERALEALRDLSSPRALVLRNGKETRVAGREVVRGDILVLQEGDRVPADATVLSSVSLSIDESLLTGESVPVLKSPAAAATLPDGNASASVYSGTMVVQGHGVAEVTATGNRTELGKIGKALKTLEPEDSPLKREVSRVAGILAVFGLSLCGFIAVAYGLTRGNWLSGLLVGITIAMSLLPEEFPVVLTVYMALGAWRISQKNVLTRNPSAIETLGSATVLCVDKTGTLTQNRMVIQKLFANGKFHAVDHAGREGLPEHFHELVEFGILASQRKPFDPMDLAFQQLGERYLLDSEHLHRDWKLLREYPLSRKLLVVSRVWQSPDSTTYTIATKGAPAAIAGLCRFTNAELEQIRNHAEGMAGEGLRILAVARADSNKEQLPDDPHAFSFRFLGLVGLSDPIRPEVPEAIRECHGAGIRVVMITGDFAGTARSIARQAGFKGNDQVLTGQELEGMADRELHRAIKNVNIFARVVPEQKLRLVEALKATGEVVAMTGDGVNDAPALKSAHIGIAMGGRGTDVAREAAQLVLLDDAFSSIVSAIRLGRRIFDNLKKAMSYVMAIHVPIAGLALIPVVLRWPLILLPVHVVFLELIIDPACSIAFEAEPEEANVMTRPPRNPHQRLFDRRTLLLSLLQGASVLLFAMAVLVSSRLRGDPETVTRAFTFATFIIANIALILANRSWTQAIIATLRSPNPALWWVVGSALGLLAIVLYVPSARELFRFAALRPIDLGICSIAGVLSIAWFEALKVFSRPHVATGH
ncbi:MAG TPA: cation-translocating P-type ATPase [Terriglobales bacterium]|nr:cation-translocating P-type ATPase [Terriglobales bacterium]